MPGGMRILLLLFLAALFGNHFEIPPKSTHRTLCARSHGEQSRTEAGSLQKPFESPVSELAFALPSLPTVLWSLDWGPGQGVGV